MEQKTLQEFRELFQGLLHREDPDGQWFSLLKEKVWGDQFDRCDEERARELALKLRRRDLFFKKKIWAALERIENGTFGECEECGCEISPSRLRARPTAELCIDCKEEVEQGENHIIYEKKSKTISVRKKPEYEIIQGGKNKDKNWAQEVLKGSQLN